MKITLTVTGVCFSNNDSCDGELTYKELASAYKDLCIRSEEVCRKVVEQKAHIDQLKLEKEKLQAKATGLQDEVKILSSNLENMTKSVMMLSPGQRNLMKSSASEIIPMTQQELVMGKITTVKA
jgi:predicted nuclease with TOPRIM domain